MSESEEMVAVPKADLLAVCTTARRVAGYTSVAYGDDENLERATAQLLADVDELLSVMVADGTGAVEGDGGGGDVV